MLSVLYWVAITYVSFFLFWGGATTCLYWYMSATYPCPKIPAPYRSFSVWFHMYTDTVKSYVLGAVLHPIGWRMNARQSFLQGEKGPVLCLHGIYENASSWLFLRNALAQRGIANTTFSYHSFCVPLKDILCALTDAVTRLEQRFPGRKPIILAHSLGGVLIRLWLMQEGNSDRLGGVLTLATPHKGSILARMAPGRLIKILIPGSSVLRELEDKEKKQHPVCPCVALVTATDEVVFPASSLLPPERWKYDILPVCSHMGVLFGKKNQRKVLEALEKMEMMRATQK